MRLEIKQINLYDKRLISKVWYDVVFLQDTCLHIFEEVISLFFFLILWVSTSEKGMSHLNVGTV